MLTAAKELIKEESHRDDIKVYLYGQELNEKTYAICKSDLLIKGDTQNLDKQVFQGDILADDKLYGKKFNFMLANPPFGVDWGKDEHTKKAVLKDNCPGGRFEAGLPSTSDGSLLFLMHMISKMDDQNGSRIGIVLNGSPLFNGDAGSGWSNIRKSLLDRNLLDAIVALPKNLFYGTDISSYLWILDNKRPAERQNKVLFIDANHPDFVNPLQKSLGKKRFEISDAGITAILNLYSAYKTSSCQIKDEETGEFKMLEIAKLLDYDDFLYTKVSTQRPLRLWFEDIIGKYSALCTDEYFDPDSKKNFILKTISQVDSINIKRSDSEFFTFLKEKKVKVAATEIKTIRAAFGIIDEDAPEVHENPLKPESNFVANSNLSDAEIIPKKVDIDEYFSREVLPFVPDAWMDRSKDKIGCEFPLTKIFYVYKAPRSSEDILGDLEQLDKFMVSELAGLKDTE